jgi:LAO/AO transport system kinase
MPPDIAAALAGDRRAVAKLLTLFERDDAAAPAARQPVAVMLEHRSLAPVIGITGAPGAGKSTLIGAACRLIAARHDRRVGVIAVDPSSRRSGGALLGDRTRIRVDDPRVFVRSQASDTHPGGIAPRTYPVVRVLRRLVDVVIVETVGVGQTEDAVATIADATYLVLQPLAGDVVQHLKAGVMEAPDAVILTKSDETRLAQRARAELEAALPLARPGEHVALFAVSGRTGDGVDALVNAWLAVTVTTPETSRDDAYLLQAVRDLHGRVGVSRLAEASLPRAGTLDDRLDATLRLVR